MTLQPYRPGCGPPATRSDATFCIRPLLDQAADWYSSEGRQRDGRAGRSRPVRATLRTTIAYPNTPGGRVSADYTVYASGRVGVYVSFTAVTGSIVLDSSEIHHLTVANAADWSGVPLADGRAAAFLRVDGPSPAANALVVDLGEHGDPGSDSTNLTVRGARTEPGTSQSARTPRAAVAPSGSSHRARHARDRRARQQCHRDLRQTARSSGGSRGDSG